MILWKFIRRLFFNTYAKGFFFSYLFMILFGAFLLSLPFSIQSGQSLSWYDALFTAASALSVTGLSTIVVGEVFTKFGLVMLLFLIQFGGMGLTMMVALFWLLARKKIGFRERSMIMTDQNQFSRSGMVRFVRNVLIMVFLIELVGFILISHYLYFAGFFGYGEALFQGLFLAISLTANAGFDIAPNADSFRMFASDFPMQLIGITLMFLGSVGYWVLAEFKEWLTALMHKEKYRFSYFVKLIFKLHVMFVLLGAVLIIAFESSNFLGDKNPIEAVFYALFMSMTTRNAGFSTMDVNDFMPFTRMLLMALMFIGASPNSFGGGIRTTSIVLVILSIKSFALGRFDVVVSRKRIKDETVYKAFVALSAGLFIVFTGSMVLSIIEPLPLESIAFEVTSAFGTTGLSMGITDQLHTLSKIILVIIMFIGRLGILALVMMFKPDVVLKARHKYPEADVIVG